MGIAWSNFSLGVPTGGMILSFFGGLVLACCFDIFLPAIGGGGALEISGLSQGITALDVEFGVWKAMSCTPQMS